MDTTYENDGGRLKIIEPVASVVSIDELVAEKTMVETEMTNAETDFTVLQAGRQARLDDVNAKIAKANELGISTPDPAPEEDPE